ncbi:MAG: ATP-binding cassette domain-containing protein [Armatimonadetes bacterium]|nr:ATP-binding cassette domain-containing protein [Armatimonadota bacterium]
MPTAVRFEGISKAYPGTQALDHVSLDVRQGSVHALMGENGAGKSTLGKILAGLVTPDEGHIYVGGSKTEIRNPSDAARAGIGMVHQELLFCDNLTVAENLCLSDLPHRSAFVQRREITRRANEALARVNAKVDPSVRLGSLPVAQQQMVQIAGALHTGAKILVFDEPTSSLSFAESEQLFELIDQLKADGVTCIYVSHRMSEIFRLCDEISILRDGQHIVTKPAAEFTPDTLAAAMIGRELVAQNAEPIPVGDVVLKVNNLQSPGKFEDVSFELRRGEILGMAGLVGAGRTEVVESIFGLDRDASGTVTLGDQPHRLGNPQAGIRRKLGLVPEDRKRHGLVLGMKIRENMTLPILPRLAKLGFIGRLLENKTTVTYFDRLRIKAPSPEYQTLGLSGGNQQKVVIAKWAAAECDVLMIDEPTRGVDIGAKAEIYEIVREIARQGKAIIMVSSELQELLQVSSRILVFREGRIVAEMPTKEASEEKIVRLMVGLT